MKPDRPDVFSWLLAEHEANPNKTEQDEMNLAGDAYLVAVAGRSVSSIKSRFELTSVATQLLPL
jgi:cytochrome P450 family 628